MEIEDMSKSLDETVLSKAAEYLRGEFVNSGNFIVIAKERQEKEMIKQLKKESHSICKDKKCQIPLGQSLSADTILRTNINHFGGVYTINTELIDLAKEATIKGAQFKFDGTEKGLMKAMDKIVNRLTGLIIEKRAYSSNSYKEISEYLNSLLLSPRNDENKVRLILQLFQKEYFTINGIAIAINELSKFPLLYKKLIERSSEECNADHGESCYYAGVLINHEKDYKNAYKFLKKACLKGFLNGCSNIGLMHLRGRGVKKSEKKALNIFKKTCDKENSGGCVLYGFMHQHGKSIEKDDKIAFELFNKACNMKNIFGCSFLGSLYFKQKALSNNEIKAINIFKKACDDGSPYACYLLGIIYFNGSEKVSKDQEKGIAFLNNSCENGFGIACKHLGLLYKNGVEVEKDEEKAAFFYERGCLEDDMTSCRELGVIYENGIWKKKDIEKAEELYLKSCEDDSLTGCNNLGWLYVRKYNSKKYKNRAYKLFKKTCLSEKDDIRFYGCYSLAIAYGKGIGVRMDESKALKILKKNCKTGHSASCSLLDKINKKR